MTKHKVTFFAPYEFQVGQKINIKSGPRHGDWRVIEVSDHKVTLQCPISKKIFKWDRFCYLAEERMEDVWPSKD